MSYIEVDGHKKWDLSSEFTDEERKLVNDAGLTVPELRVYFALQSEQNLDTAIGGLMMLKKGWGQKRSEPLSGSDVEPSV